MMNQLIKKVMILFFIVFSSTLAYAEVLPTGINHDPYEGFNRAMFHFNDALDKAIFKPVASAYNAILPKPINAGIHNFFININGLPTMANDLLQFNFYQFGNDFWRFVINSTLGVLGLFDIATRIKLEPHSNDFGLTLAKWGWKQSNFIVLPFFGPKTIRDGLSLPVDYFAFSIYPYIHPQSSRYELYTLGVIDRRAQLLSFQSVLEEAAVDQYVFVRNAYTQRRQYEIEQSSGAYSSLANATEDSSAVATESAH